MSSIQSADVQTTSSTTATSITKKKTEDPQDRFLKLLVAQVKNQDPMKPLDNAEMTSQMAQISTVTGVEKLNSTLQQLVSSAEDSRSVEAAALIGHQVYAPGSSISLNGDTGSFGIELQQPIDELKVTILDSSGIPVRQMNLGAYPAGVSTISWDGKTDSGAQAAIGEYTYTVSALQSGKDIKVETLSQAQVKGVMPGEDNTLLDLGKALGLVNLADIRQVF
ncbi:MAG: flagellar hook assembly protein FlgD [Nitrosomonas sp.]|nr:MAG: flagellar hook assembly protein FlgD [Nitrosomonas sp.]